jgi:glycosyltransferase involved in cell wall biosynthesis
MTARASFSTTPKTYDVCVITTIHRDFDNRIYLRQINSLLDAGMTVCIVAPWDFAKRTRDDYGFIATRFPPSRLSRVAHGWRTYKAAKTIEASVYIFHDNDFLPWGWLLKRRHRGSVVYDAHENIPEDIRYGKDWIPRILRRPLSVVFRFVEERIVKRLGETIVAVPNLARRFEAVGARAVLVRNFSSFSIPPGFRNDRAILYTGDLTRDYGVSNLLAIGREMKRRRVSAPLRIIDRFREQAELRRSFMQSVRDEHLAIEFLDAVPAERMPDILTKGLIGLSPIPNLPNKSLALPTKIFEYFAFGLVVLASDIAGTRDVMHNGEFGYLLKDSDIGAWVDAIQELLANPDLVRLYQERGREAARKDFNWENERARLVVYIQELLAAVPQQMVGESSAFRNARLDAVRQ